MTNKPITKKFLEQQNQKLRGALVEALMPLHLMAKYYGRPSLKQEMIAQAAIALKKAKVALDFDSEDMYYMTDSETEKEWDDVEDSADIAAWIASLEGDDDDDDD